MASSYISVEFVECLESEADMGTCKVGSGFNTCIGTAKALICPCKKEAVKACENGEEK